MNLSANLAIKIANSIANSSHQWSVVGIDEYKFSNYNGVSTSNSIVTTYRLESNTIYFSNTNQTKLRFDFVYSTTGGVYSNCQVLFDGATYDCTNNMLYANIALKANTFLTERSNTMLQLLTGPTTIATVNSTLLSKISNSIISNSGQWVVISKNETDVNKSLTDSERLIIVGLKSNRYKVDGSEMTLSYTATISKDGQLSTARLNIGQVDYLTTNTELHSTIVAKANAHSSNTESYFIQRIE